MHSVHTLPNTFHCFLLLASLNHDKSDNPEGQYQPGVSPAVITMPPSSDIHGFNHVPEAPNAVSPIMSQFQNQELGKAMLGIAVPMATGLLFNENEDVTLLKTRLIAIALSLGFAGIWNGMLLRGIYARIARAMENVGVALVIVAFYGLVSSFFPPALEWVSWLCCVLSCLPLVLSYIPIKSAGRNNNQSLSGSTF